MSWIGVFIYEYLGSIPQGADDLRVMVLFSSCFHFGTGSSAHTEARPRHSVGLLNIQTLIRTDSSNDCSWTSVLEFEISPNKLNRMIGPRPLSRCRRSEPFSSAKEKQATEKKNGFFFFPAIAPLPSLQANQFRRYSDPARM